MSRNRTAGNNWEREIVNILKTKGYPHASTSRLQSKSRDDAKVDIMNSNEDFNGRLPFNIQAKNTVDNINYHKILNEMPANAIPNVILHKKTEKRNAKFFEVGRYAILSFDYFITLISKDAENKVQPIKRRSTSGSGVSKKELL